MRANGISIGVALLLVAASCGTVQPDRTPSPSAEPPRGGTLRLAIPHDDPPPSSLASSDAARAANALDPQFAAWYDAAELHRCCLLRTLLSYVGVSTEEGGTVLRPDLAESLPHVSSDELTWTFQIRRGVRYAPPLDDVEVTAPDFVRALLRALPYHAELGGFSTLTQLGIAGVPEYLAGRTTTVSGIEIPDAYTLRIHLERPAPDLPARFAIGDTAPIPPHPADPSQALGVAAGHDEDYGRFLVSTGPYMIEGAEQLGFGLPASEQEPLTGYVPGESLVLVRNPSWNRGVDDLRPAYADRIEIAIGGTVEEASALVEDGRLDFVFNSGAPPQAPAAQIERFRGDPSLGSVHPNSRDIIRYIEMNLALPPFDDVHVRKALNLAIDKAQLLDAVGGPEAGDVAGHLILDSLEDNLLLDYDPYGTPGSHGDMTAARAELRQSRYDRDGDGACDHPACADVGILTFRLTPEQVGTVVANLAELGIVVRVEGSFPPDDVFVTWHDPAKRIGLMVGGPWAKDSLHAAHYFRPVFDSRWTITDGATNGHMVGVTRDRLEAWGYDAVDLPTVDDRIDECLAIVDSTAQVRCWAGLDQYLMEKVVPWVPLFFERYIRTVAPSVAHYSFDQLAALPALDQIALVKETQ